MLAGMFVSNQSSVVCSNCSAGKYASATGMKECEDCKPGRDQRRVRVIRGLTRPESERAQNLPGPCRKPAGNLPLLAHSSGYFASKRGAVVCDDCSSKKGDHGEYTSTTASDDCSLCVKTHYMNDKVRDN